ncbi:germin-like protein 9-2 [Pyrus ussuriensis x Pyrus communis]|uniref:Germin-like protein n=1 Tax=Pyrus ussuriensis x Pyrus communis TaxID=2448454 RepID=A0A5N5F1J4_9ROSA|nr:germin-like protein 9-2 [Pyrus ussuriensis x Pyrus communis]
MALAMRLIQVPIILAFSLATFERALLASDPDIISDFIVPPNYNGTVDGTFFTFTGFRGIFDQGPQTIKAGKASSVEFPALNGQSVSYAVLQFPPNSLLPPHTRPDATGLLFLLDGTLEVGLIDTKNNVYTQKLQTGDLFVFPKGLVHYQYNSDPQLPATAIAAFGSASARAVTVLPSVFGTGINNMILAKSFKTDVSTIENIKTGFTTH